MSRADQLAHESHDYLSGSMRSQGAYSSNVDVSDGGGKLDGTKADRNARVIRIDRIMPDPDQPREEFDQAALEQLAHSIKTIGLQQPIRVRWSEVHDRWIVVAGERRYRAHQLAGIDTASCTIETEQLAADELLERQLAENKVRQALNPIELAKSYARLIEARGLKPGQLAERIKVHRTTIIRSLELLQLPEDVQGMIVSGQLPVSSARSLTKAKSEDEMRALLKEFKEGTVPTHEAAAKVSKKAKPKSGKAKTHKLKQFTAENGIQIMFNSKRRLPIAECVQAAKEFIAQQEADGRIGTRRAA